MNHSFLPITESGKNRAYRSEQKLQELNLCLDGLPAMYYCDEHLSIRPLEHVVRRFIALTILVSNAEGLESHVALDLAGHFHITNEYTVDERKFIENPNKEPNSSRLFQWQYERAWVLLWALGFIDDLGSAAKPCDGRVPGEILRQLGTTGAILEESKLRAKEEILDLADLYYRFNEIRKHYYERGKEIPASLEPAVVYERHFGLSWLIGFGQKEWEELGEVL